MRWCARLPIDSCLGYCCKQCDVWQSGAVCLVFAKPDDAWRCRTRDRAARPAHILVSSMVALVSQHRRNAFRQRHELRDAMPIGLGRNDIDRKILRVDEKVVFALRLAAINWVRSSFSPMYGRFLAIC